MRFDCFLFTLMKSLSFWFASVRWGSMPQRTESRRLVRSDAVAVALVCRGKYTLFYNTAASWSLLMESSRQECQCRFSSPSMRCASSGVCQSRLLCGRSPL